MNHEGHEDHEEKLTSCVEGAFSIEPREAGLIAMPQVEIPVFF